MSAFGPNEIALRLFPFLASIASLILIYRFCSENLGRVSGVVAVALAGVMPALFYYSGELKQYSSDVASALLILVLASGALAEGPDGRPGGGAGGGGDGDRLGPRIRRCSCWPGRGRP